MTTIYHLEPTCGKCGRSLSHLAEHLARIVGMFNLTCECGALVRFENFERELARVEIA